MVFEAASFAYLWFDELNESVPLGTPILAQQVEPLNQGVGQVEHASTALREVIIELSDETRAAVPAQEFVSREHRDEIRKLLIRCSGIMGTGTPVTWGGDPNVGLRQRIVESHYPELAERVEAWNAVAARARPRRRHCGPHFERELASPSHSERYNVNAIVNGFAGWTERRALEGTLGEPLARSSRQTRTAA